MEETDFRQYEPFWGDWYIKAPLGEGSYGKCFIIEKTDLMGHTSRSAMKVISVPQRREQINSIRSTGMTEADVNFYFRDAANAIANEFRTMEQLKGNSHIVSYEDHDIRQHADGIGYDIFIRMELLTPIDRYFAANGMTEESVARLGADICMALESCAGHKIIHRDIKRENIFVSDDGNFKLGDFGIAKTIERSCGEYSKKGTPNYMAPEVFLNGSYDERVDIFSLGVVLYTLLNDNRIPFLPYAPEPYRDSDKETAIERRLRLETPPPPRHAGKPLSDIILKACAGDCSKRYASATQLRADLERFLKGNGSAVQPDAAAAYAKAPEPPKPADNRTPPNPAETAAGNTAPRQKTPAPAQVMPKDVHKPEKQTKDAPANKRKRVPIAVWIAAAAVLVTLLIGGALFKIIRGASADQWEFLQYDETYPFYAIEEQYVNGKPTGKTRIDTSRTKYEAGRAKLYVVTDEESNEFKRVLYVDGLPADYEEDVTELGGDFWMIEGIDPDTFRQYARHYVDGTGTDEIELTNVQYEPYYYIKSEFGETYRIVYADGKPLEKTRSPFEAYNDYDWVIDGKTYIPGTYEEVARLYANGVPCESSLENWYEDASVSRKTGVVYRYFDYVFYDTAKSSYYHRRFVNGSPTDEVTYIDAFGESEWVVEFFDPDTKTVTRYYNEQTNEQYAYHFSNGLIEPDVRKPTGVDTLIEEWVTEENSLYTWERKYVNGKPTEERRNNKPKTKDTAGTVTNEPAGTESTGNAGNTGSADNTGSAGNTGSTGNAGYTGSAGNTGSTGSTPVVEDKIEWVPESSDTASWSRKYVNGVPTDEIRDYREFTVDWRLDTDYNGHCFERKYVDGAATASTRNSRSVTREKVDVFSDYDYRWLYSDPNTGATVYSQHIYITDLEVEGIIHYKVTDTLNAAGQLVGTEKHAVTVSRDSKGNVTGAR